jgi:hypothetical protein
MRFLSLVAITSLALAVPGCTLVGAGSGALVATTENQFRDSASDDHASVGTYALVGAGIGLLVDILVVKAIGDSLSHMRFN